MAERKTKVNKRWKMLIESVKGGDVVVAIFGPTGCGKSTYKDHLAQRGWRHIKSYTTRPPRAFEESEYHFVSPKEYNDLFARGHLTNTNRYDGHQYGTNINDFMQPGKAVIITDASSIAKLNRFAEQNGKNMKFMHCMIDDVEEFEKRHTDRGTPERIKMMKREMEEQSLRKSLVIPNIREKMYLVYDLEDLQEFIEEIENE